VFFFFFFRVIKGLNFINKVAKTSRAICRTTAQYNYLVVQSSSVNMVSTNIVNSVYPRVPELSSSTTLK